MSISVTSIENSTKSEAKNCPLAFMEIVTFLMTQSFGRGLCIFISTDTFFKGDLAYMKLFMDWVTIFIENGISNPKEIMNS